ncbi:MAG: Rpp14/Pop5 family protein [Minisyncoccales bacterium]
MKPLKPSMREKKRYLLIKGKNIEEEIKNSILEFIGIAGMAEANLKIIKKTNDSIIISINREALNKVRAGFALNKKEIKVEKVSGTLKSLQK